MALSVALNDDIELEAEKRKSVYYTEKNPKAWRYEIAWWYMSKEW